MKFKELLKVYKGEWHARASVWSNEKTDECVSVSTWAFSQEELKMFKDEYGECEVEEIEYNRFGGVTILIKAKKAQLHVE